MKIEEAVNEIDDITTDFNELRAYISEATLKIVVDVWKYLENKYPNSGYKERFHEITKEEKLSKWIKEDSFLIATHAVLTAAQTFEEETGVNILDTVDVKI